MKTYWYIEGDYEEILKVSKLFYDTFKYNDFVYDSRNYKDKQVVCAYLSDNAIA